MAVVSRTVRLERLRSLRRLHAPRWVVRTEQCAMLLNSRGLKHQPPGKPFSKAQQELYSKFVVPELEAEK